MLSGHFASCRGRSQLRGLRGFAHLSTPGAHETMGVCLMLVLHLSIIHSRGLIQNRAGPLACASPTVNPRQEPICVKRRTQRNAARGGQQLRGAWWWCGGCTRGNELSFEAETRRSFPRRARVVNRRVAKAWHPCTGTATRQAHRRSRLRVRLPAAPLSVDAAARFPVFRGSLPGAGAASGLAWRRKCSHPIHPSCT